MLLAIELDNSEICFGLFEHGDDYGLILSFKISADIKKTTDEYSVTVASLFDFYKVRCQDINGAIISSVVPQLTEVIFDMVKRLVGVEPLVVGKGIKTGFPIKIDNPSELGADLVANAAAAVDLIKKEHVHKKPCIIIDMGTATTIFAINANGEYIGGSIFSGVGMALDALHGMTAQLPTVSPITPTRAIGKNSQDCVRSGVILGNAMMIDGFVDRFSKEMKCEGNVEIFITGEYARTVIESCSHSMRYIPHLTLIGLDCIYKNNIDI